MPSKKKQTRVSISVKGLTAQRLEDLAEKLDRLGAIEQPGKSTALEHIIAKTCEFYGIPEHTELRPRSRKYPAPGPKPGHAERHGGMFTF